MTLGLRNTLVPITVLLLTLAGSVGSVNAQDDLVLCNKLGSNDEVLNSEVGAGFGIHSDFQGGVIYVPGFFGNAMATTGGGNGGGGYLTMSPGDFLGADRTRGTVEGWFQKRIDRFLPFRTPLLGPFGRQPFAPSPDFTSILAIWGDGFTGSGTSGMDFFIKDSFGTHYSCTDVGWDNVPVGVWTHMAFVWDLAGIDGSPDTMRIYRDGAMVAACSHDIPDVEPNENEVRVMGHHAYDRFGQPTAYLDHIKVWAHAKTDFSERFVESCGSIDVPVDIKPGSCPNPLNVRSHGLISVAIAGTLDLDVTEIDAASVRLAGVAAVKSSVEDVTTPFEPYVGKASCTDCLVEGPDGEPDLTLRFEAQEVLDALGVVEDGECVVVALTGNLLEEFGGTRVLGEDVVRILSKKGGGGGDSPEGGASDLLDQGGSGPVDLQGN